MPCTTDLAKNVTSIKASLDWAAENKVDYLLTPEGALTGYIPDFDTRGGRTFDDVLAAEQELIDYCREKQTGLLLGTMYIDDGLRRNQIRAFNLAGTLIGTANKTAVVGDEKVVPATDGPQFIQLHIPHTTTLVKTAGLICNDMWGGGYHVDCLANKARLQGAQLIVHATNAWRGFNQTEDDVLNDWTNANLRFMSYFTTKAIITVDNSIMHNGVEYDGYTASESGVLVQGNWKTQVPRTGAQNFYYDFNFVYGQLMIEN